MTFVLIPGAGGSGWFWHRTVRALVGRAARALPVTLPAGDESKGLADYADAVADQARECDEVTLVAQSMGGFCVPFVVDLLPVREVVLVNAMIPVAGESAGEWW